MTFHLLINSVPTSIFVVVNLYNNVYVHMRVNIIVSSLLSLLLYSGHAAAAPVDVDLTVGTWAVSATDDIGINWEGSTLVFEMQTADGDNWLLEGFFDWIGDNGAFGRENFTGSLFADSTMELTGFEIVLPASGIVTANYFAILSASGNEIIDGSWDGSGIPSDDWSAVRVVPLPGAVWLLASALVGLVFGTRRRDLH
ncbi:MAG: hypothetical protein KJO54_01445 [Gammaproteobacteria bacterium]|nr:hypothetical protein [Gammaproteobacteria bacterium]NNF60472.1 hypothetical protein [Gammaproteobacteria bacterium]